MFLSSNSFIYADLFSCNSNLVLCYISDSISEPNVLEYGTFDKYRAHDTLLKWDPEYPFLISLCSVESRAYLELVQTLLMTVAYCLSLFATKVM